MGLDTYAMHGAVTRWGSAQQIKHRKEYYEKYPMHGVSICAMHGLVMPDWLARSFLRSYRKAIFYEVATWDEAFGLPHKKGAKLPQLRAKRLNEVKIWNAVSDRLLSNPSTSINRILFDEIGEILGISGSSAERIFYEFKAWSGMQLP